MTQQTQEQDKQRPWWRDRTEGIELQVAIGQMNAMACYTNMLQLLDAEYRAGQAASAQAVPQGWKLVPEEPTPEMLKAAKDGDEEYSRRNFGNGMHIPQGGEDHWVAMLAAAPQPEAQAAPSLAEVFGKFDNYANGFKDGYREARQAVAASAVDAKQAVQMPEPTATVDSWTNGSYSRNYKITWHCNAQAGANLYTGQQVRALMEKD